MLTKHYSQLYYCKIATYLVIYTSPVLSSLRWWGRSKCECNQRPEVTLNKN